MEQVAPLEAPILDSVFAPLDPEQGAPLESPVEVASLGLTDVPSLELSEAPFEMELFAPIGATVCFPGAGAGCSFGDSLAGSLIGTNRGFLIGYV
jgi:hypothetical protein